MLGIAIASQELTLVFANQEGQEREPYKVPYSKVAKEQILAELEKAPEPKVALIGGNRRWALPIAYALWKNKVQVRYLAGPKQAHGAKQNHAKMVKKALEANFAGKPFFKEIEGGKVQFGYVEPEVHPDVALGNQYFLLQDEIRKVKHRILNNLRLVFREVTDLGDKLWVAKRFVHIKERNWAEFGKEIGITPENSICADIPQEVKNEAEEKIRDLCLELKVLEEKEDVLKKDVIAKTQGSKVIELLGEGFSANLIALFVGWQSWGSARTPKKGQMGFRALRHFAGLDVSRMDAKGNMKISRSRPNVRTVFYHALKTKKGKEVTGELTGRWQNMVVSALQEKFGGEAMSNLKAKFGENFMPLLEKTYWDKPKEIEEDMGKEFFAELKLLMQKRPGTCKKIERILLKVWQECLKARPTEPAEAA
ncbi:MAG: hypothetical protein AAB877_01830 [Patescibacteria group bacterium]